MREDPRPVPLIVATLLAWLWAVVMLLLSVAAAIPAVAQGPGLPPAVGTAALLSVATGIAAYGLGRLKRPWVMLGACVGWFVYLGLVPLRVSVAGFVVNALIVAAVVTNLRRFR